MADNTSGKGNIGTSGPKNLRRSKITSWLALVIAVVIIIMTFSMRAVWWQFIDVFFLFMCAFTRLLSVYFGGISPAAARKLNSISLVCCIGFVIAFVVEFFLMQ
ncbi:MAG: hypothetical protein K2O24_07270 [Muribaculaceae bacterium]|nr:hypothetical protein [Muribaculaceae bacterium]